MIRFGEGLSLFVRIRKCPGPPYFPGRLDTVCLHAEAVNLSNFPSQGNSKPEEGYYAVPINTAVRWPLVTWSTPNPHRVKGVLPFNEIRSRSEPVLFHSHSGGQNEQSTTHVSHPQGHRFGNGSRCRRNQYSGYGFPKHPGNLGRHRTLLPSYMGPSAESMT